MPIYKYKVVNSSSTDEFLEVEQDINSEPIKVHPITGEPVIKVLSSASLCLNHFSSKENKSLSPENLSKHGFTKYERDSSGDYHRTTGMKGPEKISAEEIEHP